ncbi:MAG: LysR substrate-binding domain-containing protein [Oscillospiraceae bacterium]
MNSQQIEYVLKVAKLRSFSKAAQELYVTQPSLSQFIMKTEQKLGFQIFDRSSSPIGLTPSGEVFVSYAEQFKALEESMNNRLSDIERLNTGTLRIGASSFRASCLLSKSIAEFSRKYSGIKIAVTEDNDASLAEMVKNNKLDVIITAGEHDPTVFHTEELAMERLFLAVPKEHPINDSLGAYLLSEKDIKERSIRLITAPTVEPDVISGLTFIIAENLETAAEPLGSLFKYGEKNPSIALRVRTIETAFAFVNAGLGASFIPDTLIRYGTFGEHPCYYAVDPKLSETAIRLCSKKNGYFSNAAKQYCLTLKQLIDIGTWRV